MVTLLVPNSGTIHMVNGPTNLVTFEMVTQKSSLAPKWLHNLFTPLLLQSEGLHTEPYEYMNTKSNP
jgi:hypothetical protein